MHGCLAMQGGRLEIGAPTGKWQLIVVYRGKHCPVSKNYLASLQQIIYELDELGVEVIAVSSDGRERAEAFVSRPTVEQGLFLVLDLCCVHHL
jgi:peroxiredoxin